MTTNIHDSGYKKLLSNHTIFRQLLRTFIKQDWVDELDFNRCETLDKSFISDNYKKTESDLIYKVKVRGKTVYIYILLEFQSSVDRFMVVRVLNYITNFYLDYVATHRRIKKLPAIFPVVLYNGKKKWTAVQEIADLIESEPALGQYALHFQYLLINEKGYSRQQLLKIRNIVSTLFLAEAHYDIKLLETELLNLYEREEDKEAVSLFLNWFKQLALYGKVSPEDYGQLDYVYRTKEEVQTMLAATLEQERQKIYQKGEAAGLTKGRIQTIGELLHFRFELDEVEQAKYIQQVARIDELPHLDELVNTLLNKAATLEDFTKLVAKHLPADKAA
ncbi:MAG: Rpn family recombination-promoting nuclease/putative transposase [Caldilineaceae bacterium]